MNNLKDLLGARLFLLDMDGTLYLGDDVFPGAVDFIHTLAETGRQYIYLTNNSSRAGTDYITRLRRLGFPCEAENVFTSGMATALYLNQHYAGKPVYLVGTQAFRRELLSYGIPLVEEGAEIVVAGFDTELVYEKLDKAVHFLRRGAAFIAANPDWVCPMPAGEVLPVFSQSGNKESVAFIIQIIQKAADPRTVNRPGVCCAEEIAGICKALRRLCAGTAPQMRMIRQRRR